MRDMGPVSASAALLLLLLFATVHHAHADVQETNIDETIQDGDKKANEEKSDESAVDTTEDSLASDEREPILVPYKPPIELDSSEPKDRIELLTESGVISHRRKLSTEPGDYFTKQRMAPADSADYSAEQVRLPFESRENSADQREAVANAAATANAIASGNAAASSSAVASVSAEAIAPNFVTGIGPGVNIPYFPITAPVIYTTRVIPKNELIHLDKIPGASVLVQCSREGEIHTVVTPWQQCMICVCIGLFRPKPVCASCADCAAKGGSIVPIQAHVSEEIGEHLLKPTPLPIFPTDSPDSPPWYSTQKPPFPDNWVIPTPPPPPVIPDHEPTLYPTQPPIFHWDTTPPPVFPWDTTPPPVLPWDPTPSSVIPTLPPPPPVPATCAPLPTGQVFQHPFNPCQNCICSTVKGEVRISCRENKQCVPSDEIDNPKVPPSTDPVPSPECGYMPLNVPFPHPTDHCKRCVCMNQLLALHHQTPHLLCLPIPGCDNGNNPGENIWPTLTPPPDYPVIPTVPATTTPVPWPPIIVYPDDDKRKKGPLLGPPPHKTCAPYPLDTAFQHPWDECQVCKCSEYNSGLGETSIEVNCYTKDICCILPNGNKIIAPQNGNQIVGPQKPPPATEIATKESIVYVEPKCRGRTPMQPFVVDCHVCVCRVVYHFVIAKCLQQPNCKAKGNTYPGGFQVIQGDQKIYTIPMNGALRPPPYSPTVKPYPQNLFSVPVYQYIQPPPRQNTNYVPISQFVNPELNNYPPQNGYGHYTHIYPENQNQYLPGQFLEQFGEFGSKDQYLSNDYGKTSYPQWTNSFATAQADAKGNSQAQAIADADVHSGNQNQYLPNSYGVPNYSQWPNPLNPSNGIGQPSLIGQAKAIANAHASGNSQAEFGNQNQYLPNSYSNPSYSHWPNSLNPSNGIGQSSIGTQTEAVANAQALTNSQAEFGSNWKQRPNSFSASQGFGQSVASSQAEAAANAQASKYPQWPNSVSNAFGQSTAAAQAEAAANAQASEYPQWPNTFGQSTAAAQAEAAANTQASEYPQWPNTFGQSSATAQAEAAANAQASEYPQWPNTFGQSSAAAQAKAATNAQTSQYPQWPNTFGQPSAAVQAEAAANAQASEYPQWPNTFGQSSATAQAEATANAESRSNANAQLQATANSAAQASGNAQASAGAQAQVGGAPKNTYELPVQWRTALNTQDKTATSNEYPVSPDGSIQPTTTIAGPWPPLRDSSTNNYDLSTEALAQAMEAVKGRVVTRGGRGLCQYDGDMYHDRCQACRCLADSDAPNQLYTLCYGKPCH